MNKEEFFNRLINKIDKEFGYDVANTLQLMFMTREKKIEQLENIRKEIKEYIEKNVACFKNGDMLVELNVDDLLNILNKGDNNGK